VQQGSLRLKLLIGLGLFLIAGIEMTTNGWLPTYGVQIVGLTTSEVTIYGTFFWTMSTTFRFAAAVTSVPSSYKLIGLVTSMLVCSLFCILLQNIGSYSYAADFGSLSYGVNSSAVFPLLVSISTEYNIRIEPK
jgi:fucose permease